MLNQFSYVLDLFVIHVFLLIVKNTTDKLADYKKENSNRRYSFCFHANYPPIA